MSPAVRKPRRKPDGSYEVPFECKMCGSKKCEVNSVSRLWSCWSCGTGGAVSGGLDTGNFFLSAKDGLRKTGSTAPHPPHAAGLLSWEEELELTDKLPVFALRECMKRRQEPQWLIRRYKVRWSYKHGRLWFPAGDGGVLRSVLSWEDPKTFCLVGASQEKRMVGEHLLKPAGVSPGYSCEGNTQGTEISQEPGRQPAGLRLVLVEGDWKSVSIPIPWVGLGLQGTVLTDSMRDKILLSSPASVVVMLDGGWSNAAQKIAMKLLPLQAKIVELPEGKGPDDVPRRDLVKLLLGTERNL